MKRNVQLNEYEDLIDKIRKKRKLVVILTVIMYIAVIAVSSPTHLEILDETIIDTKGIHPVFSVLLFLLIIIIEIFAYAFVSMPTVTSLDVECDPQKYIVLNSALTKGQRLISVYASGYLCMGDFQNALVYAEQMIASGKKNLIIIGLFNKTRCQFFTGDYEAMKYTVQQFEAALFNTKKASHAYQKYYDIIILMCAIADKNQDKINEYRNVVQAWNNTNAIEGFINYLKGVAAYSVDDKEESIYRFMAVKEHCEKTVFSRLADEYLSLLK